MSQFFIEYEKGLYFFSDKPDKQNSHDFRGWKCLFWWLSWRIRIFPCFQLSCLTENSWKPPKTGQQSAGNTVLTKWLSIWYYKSISIGWTKPGLNELRIWRRNSGRDRYVEQKAPAFDDFQGIWVQREFGGMEPRPGKDGTFLSGTRRPQGDAGMDNMLNGLRARP